MNRRTLAAGMVLGVCLTLLLLGFVAALRRLGRWTASEPVRLADPPAVLRLVEPLRELVSVKYSIQKVIGLREEKHPLGAESILLIVQGTVLGGIDLKDLAFRDIEVARGQVRIKLPPAQILHVSLDEKHTQVWDRKVTWWTPWVPYNPDLDRKARLAAVESIRAQAEQLGILLDARQNAERTLRALLLAGGAADVTFLPD